MIRPYMQLGWFMAYALGAMHIRDNGHVVVKAWCADTEDAAPSDALSILDVDHEQGRVTVGSSRYAGKRVVTLQEQAGAIEQAHSEFKAGEQIAMMQCPQCQKIVPARELEDIHGCCLNCYWENG